MKGNVARRSCCRHCFRYESENVVDASHSLIITVEFSNEIILHCTEGYRTSELLRTSLSRIIKVTRKALFNFRISRIFEYFDLFVQRIVEFLNIVPQNMENKLFQNIVSLFDVSH